MFRHFSKLTARTCLTHKEIFTKSRNISHTLHPFAIFPCITRKSLIQAWRPLFSNPNHHFFDSRLSCRDKIINRLRFKELQRDEVPASTPASDILRKLAEKLNIKPGKSPKFTVKTAGKIRKFIGDFQRAQFGTSASKWRPCKEGGDKVDPCSAKKKRKNPKKSLGGKCPYIKEECLKGGQKDGKKRSAKCEGKKGAECKKAVPCKKKGGGRSAKDPCEGIDKGSSKKSGKQKDPCADICGKKKKGGKDDKCRKAVSCASKKKGKKSKGKSTCPSVADSCGSKKSKGDPCATKKSKSDPCASKKSKDDPCRAVKSKKSDPCASKKSRSASKEDPCQPKKSKSKTSSKKSCASLLKGDKAGKKKGKKCEKKKSDSKVSCAAQKDACRAPDADKKVKKKEKRCKKPKDFGRRPQSQEDPCAAGGGKEKDACGRPKSEERCPPAKQAGKKAKKSCRKKKQKGSAKSSTCSAGGKSKTASKEKPICPSIDSGCKAKKGKQAAKEKPICPRVDDSCEAFKKRQTGKGDDPCAEIEKKHKSKECDDDPCKSKKNDPCA